MKKNVNDCKRRVRAELKKHRLALSQPRRIAAAQELWNTLTPKLTSPTLSFHSLPQEIDTTQLNLFLAHSNNLLLPKVCGNHLNIFHVNDLDEQLELGAFGILEPIPDRCVEVLPEQIEIVLVPALGFDHANHRIGYGLGYYDRFLASLNTCVTIGIGYKEQRITSLPTLPTDIPLHHVYLF